MERKKCAYVTLVMKGDFYVPGALVLARSLRQTQTAHDLVCMVTDDVVHVDALQQLFDRVVTVGYISGDHHPFPDEKTLQKYANWEHASMTQHQCLALDSYEKICFLDADVVVLKNMDHIFELRTPAGTFYEQIPKGRKKHTERVHGELVPARYILQCLQAGVYVCVGNCLVLSPGRDTFQRFMRYLAWFLETHDNKFGFEKWKAHINEQMIAHFYASELGVDWTFVGLGYQTVPWKYVDPDTHLYHYMSTIKPWEAARPCQFTKQWFEVWRLLLREHPHFKAIPTQRPAAPPNVIQYTRLHVPKRPSYGVHTDPELHHRIKKLNKSNPLKPHIDWGLGAKITTPIVGAGVFQYTGGDALMRHAEDELQALFKSKARFAGLLPYQGKRGLTALFWPESNEEAVSLQTALVGLRGALAKVLLSFYAPLMASILCLSEEAILEAAFEIIHYHAVPAAGLEQHVDNVTRTKGVMGPVCSINFVTDRCMDLLPLEKGGGVPVRVFTMPGDLLILDSDARIRWSHAVPYGCSRDRYSVVIRPMVQTTRLGQRGVAASLGVPVYAPSTVLCNASGSRQERPSAFAQYGCRTLSYTAKDAKYITWPWDAWERNAYLSAWVRQNDLQAPVIWDVFAGVGGDALQFLGLFPQAQITAVQRATEDKREDRLMQNLKDRCTVRVCDAAFFLLSCTRPCDLLYLDPPWTGDRALLSAPQFAANLKRDVLDALVTGCALVCLKTRFPWAALGLGFKVCKTVQVTQHYFFHFFSLVQSKKN
jgi:hypothetical protein